jgi:hypothetical protein
MSWECSLAGSITGPVYKKIVQKHVLPTIKCYSHMVMGGFKMTMLLHIEAMLLLDFKKKDLSKCYLGHSKVLTLTQ